MDPRDSRLSRFPGRRELEAVLSIQVAGALARGESLALILTDIDGFKWVNTRYGYQVGDAVLLEFARRLVWMAGSVQAVFRYGGEEFAVVLPGRSMLDVAELRQLIQAAIGEPSEVRHVRGLTLTARLGFAFFPTDGTTVRALLDAAQRHMSFRGPDWGPPPAGAAVLR